MKCNSCNKQDELTLDGYCYNCSNVDEIDNMGLQLKELIILIQTLYYMNDRKDNN